MSRILLFIARQLDKEIACKIAIIFFANDAEIVASKAACSKMFQPEMGIKSA